MRALGLLLSGISELKRKFKSPEYGMKEKMKIMSLWKRVLRRPCSGSRGVK